MLRPAIFRPSQYFKPKTWMWIKIVVVFTSVSSLGPILLHYVPPTEEEVFARYSPELKKRSLENRDRLREEWTDYITKLNELSKSDLNIWEAWKEEERNRVKAEAEALEKKTEQLRLRMKEEEEPSASTK